jgi:3-hydroxy-9,10-secoandrosta-1,3,5(10)-triene-9,17-dione monooxygenase
MTRTKSTRLSHTPLTAFSHQQIRIAETAVEIATMQLLLQQNLERARSENPTLEQRVQSKRNFSYVAHLALQAIERIYITSGGTANYKTNPLQRFWRDIHAMAAHAALNWDTAGETFGLYEIGQTHNPRDSFV